MVTSEQVARLAGVSRATVSRTLNGSSRVSEKTKERIFNAIAALEYDKDMRMPQPHGVIPRNIALALFDDELGGLNLSRLVQTSHYFYLNILTHIEKLVAEAQYDLFLPAGRHGSHESVEEAQIHYRKTLQANYAAGVIAVCVTSTDPRIQVLHRFGIPTVFVDSILQGERATWVKSDYTDGARQAVEYLLSLGHRRIAFFHGNAIALTTAERLLGWQQALGRAGLTIDPQLMCLTGWERRDAYTAAMELLSKRRDFTAIAASSDMMALGILQALQKHGLRVPEDISLIGFDDIDCCEEADPLLTTIRQDVQAISQGTVSRLLQLIEGVQAPEPLLVPTRLIPRGSTRSIL